jgi:hypothetical protein
MECKSFTMKEQSSLCGWHVQQCNVGLKGCERNAQRIKYAIVRDRKID